MANFDSSTDFSAYQLADGSKVPGVTKVLGNLGWKTSGLVKWAYKRGLDGKELYGEKATTIGDEVHKIAERALKEHADVSVLARHASDYRVKKAARALDRWLTTYEPVLVASEEPLVSEIHRYCGRLDLVVEFPRLGTLAMVDLKVARGVYNDMIIQMAAYRQLWRENHPDRPLDEIHLLQLGKFDGKLTPHSWEATDEIFDHGFEVFRHLIPIHGLKWKLDT